VPADHSGCWRRMYPTATRLNSVGRVFSGFGSPDLVRGPPTVVYRPPDPVPEATLAGPRRVVNAQNGHHAKRGRWSSGIGAEGVGRSSRYVAGGIRAADSTWRWP